MLAQPPAAEIAARIFAGATGGAFDDVEDAVATVAGVYATLEQTMSTLIGTAGYRALVARAVSKAMPRHPCLKAVVLGTGDGFLEPLLSRLRIERPATIRIVAAALLAEFIEVLATLIGSELTLRRLQSAWPEATTSALEAVGES